MTKNPEAGNWVGTTIDEAGSLIGQYASIALESTQRIYIAYYDGNGKDLKFAHLNNDIWGTFIVDGQTNEVGSYCSLALDLNGVPHITYYDETNVRLKHVAITGLD